MGGWRRTDTGASFREILSPGKRFDGKRKEGKRRKRVKKMLIKFPLQVLTTSNWDQKWRAECWGWIYYNLMDGSTCSFSKSPISSHLQPLHPFAQEELSLVGSLMEFRLNEVENLHLQCDLWKIWKFRGAAPRASQHAVLLECTWVGDGNKRDSFIAPCCCCRVGGCTSWWIKLVPTNDWMHCTL